MLDAIIFHPGDVFRWSYKDQKLDQNFISYLAKSQIAISTDSNLYDTYWYWEHGIDADSWPHDQAREKLTLIFLGNLNDYEKHIEGDADLYDDSDCLNLNNANSSQGNFYVRKDAKRSEAKIRETIRYRIEKAQHDRDSAIREISRLDMLEAEIVAGKPLEEIYL